ncbi:hypothetical protein CMU11_00860 [Elizabethkingia anophelis]|uniref:hypothetical protein n=1 Tax=Elizabethkingia miricola TaxID=172045 RepID=UPI00099B1885|nr:hypothetical protein [Elizabethkingia miricola]MDV2493888.1 hypothetical protein [Elizabethkingia anophelis]MDV3567852.1 hypothetical protein [Elizabethkingia anophelis]MDV3633953.1 hypothetical protein [Elizabethkingia anophelis]MDV3708800.1 hypothetical protein [Elizabethkingia anophelis]MDV3732281.1 hypothetical protein [Elizabethkingia anophelis]
MDKKIEELYQTNDDIIFILNTASKIGWNEVKPQSLHRIIYLSKVLYSFVNDLDPNIFKYYHFTSNISGPVSSGINGSLADLESREFVVVKDLGLELHLNGDQLKNILDSSVDNSKKNKQAWFVIIMLLLGKFGENKIFSFTINDPLYVENIESNSSTEISFENNENKTLKVLNSFKEEFEKSIDDTSSITNEEYLELYFDYVFSQLIK